MKVAVIYNRHSTKVINVFGVPSREKYGLASIQRIVAALKKGGHQVMAIEGDKDLIPNLESFMSQALKGENPGMALNLAYGIQGQARYTHVPGILEMVGIPYVGSGPLGHSLSLDKVVAKMLFVQNDVPTPEFVVLEHLDFPPPPLPYPLIVKPKHEAVSFGLRIVHDEAELREAVHFVLEQFGQAALVERFIDGRELNVGLLGNGNPEAFPVVELLFEHGPRIYTEADKKGKGEKRISIACPADLDPELTARVQALARRAFTTLGLLDCARVDMRLDAEGRLYVLETNSLPSLGERGSYTRGAAEAGLDFTALVNRLIEVASARYFGTPAPTHMAASPHGDIFTYITARRDRIERRIEKYVAHSSRSDDPIGLSAIADEVGARLDAIGLVRRNTPAGHPSTWVWETPASLEGGTLLVVPLDIPLAPEAVASPFRRDPEWLYGEGIALSRAPLAAMEFALRALRPRRLKKLRIGVLLHGDEGHDNRWSAAVIRDVAERAARVLVLRPGNPGDLAVSERRGQRRYRLRVEGSPRRLGTADSRRGDALMWLHGRAQELSALSSRRSRCSVDLTDVRTHAFPMLVPHRVDATVTASFPNAEAGLRLEQRMREVLESGDAVRYSFAPLSDRPPMRPRPEITALAASIQAVANGWELPFGHEASVLPSAAGLVPEHKPVLCGLGPIGRDLYTSQEAVRRVSIIQRTLLLSAFLAHVGD